jgi:plasmid stability protein
MVYSLCMASILLKDIPPELHERLRQAAARDHRSLNKEVIALLETALQERSGDLPPPISAEFPITQDWLEHAVSAGRD